MSFVCQTPQPRLYQLLQFCVTTYPEPVVELTEHAFVRNLKYILLFVKTVNLLFDAADTYIHCMGDCLPMTEELNQLETVRKTFIGINTSFLLFFRFYLFSG